MKSGIYCIQNIVTGKIYIGSAVDLAKREIVHKSNLKNNRHHNVKLQNSYNKHRLENFKWFVLEYCEVENLITAEQFYIDTLEPWYNICRTAGSCLGRKFSEKTIAKLSLSKQNMSDETKQRMSEAQRGNNKGVKPFKIVSPAGEIIEGVNLYKFCLENNLNVGNMSQLVNSKRKSHKGYTAHKTL